MEEVATKSAEKWQKLLQLLAGKRSLLIVMQDNPDPDSIAAATALRRLANAHFDIQCSIAYGGVIGRAENRALAAYLGLNFRRIAEVDVSKYDATALVDTQPGTGNNSLPPDRTPDIVIDHHPLQKATRAAPFNDVRSRYGAVSTILYQYLRETGIEPDPPLATALLYAIRTDTQDLGRQACQEDVEAVGALYPLANARMLSAIQRGRVKPEYFQVLHHGLEHARVYENCILCPLHEVHSPDMAGETADLLMRHEGIEWVITCAFHAEKMWISLRTSQSDANAGETMARIVRGIGTGGGHGGSAGGQIALTKGTRAERSELVRKVRQRFLRQTGCRETRGRKLVAP